MNKNLNSIIMELKKGLSSPDLEVRKKSVLMFSRIDAPEVIEVLLPLKDDDSEEIRRISSKIIGILTQKYNQEAPLVSPQQKEEIKAEIEDSGFDIQKLIHYISSGARENKIAAITAFYGVKDSRAIKLFKEKLVSEKDVAVIATYVKAIGTSGGADEINYLIDYISYNDNRVKSNAIEALCMLGANYEVFEDVLPLIADSDERVKISAFQYFARIDKDVMISEIDNILRGNDNDLKAFAIKLTFFYEPALFIKLYGKYFEGLNNGLKSLIIKNLKESSDPAAYQFVEKYDAVGFDNDFIDSSFFDDKTGRDIFDIANGIKKDEEFFFDEGMLLFDMGNFERAIVEFNRSTRVNPSYARAWKQKASAYAQIENYKKAFECIEKAIELNPGDDDAIYNKALILQQSGDDIGAAKCFEATNKVKFSSNVFTKSKDKKSSSREIEDTIDRLIDESASASDAGGGDANDAIDRLIDEIRNDSGTQPGSSPGAEAFKIAMELSLDEASLKAQKKIAVPEKTPDEKTIDEKTIDEKTIDEKTIDGKASDEYSIKNKETASSSEPSEQPPLPAPSKQSVSQGLSKQPPPPEPSKQKPLPEPSKRPAKAAKDKRAPAPSKQSQAPPPAAPEKPLSAAEIKSYMPPVPADDETSLTASGKTSERRKKTKAPSPAAVDNTVRNSVIGLVIFAAMVFAAMGLYYDSSNDELNSVSLIRHFQRNSINGELVHLERFAYMDESIVERVDYKGPAFSIRILKVKTPAKAESIRKSRDEGRDWHLNKNFLIAIDRGEAEKILSAFNSFK
jgi:tetratricopeptide (TPR) repeat protein